MRKNQRYSQEKMSLAIELWQESGLSHRKFCVREKLSSPNFGYWLRKYRNETEAPAEEETAPEKQKETIT